MWVGICAWRDTMGQRLLLVQKRLPFTQHINLFSSGQSIWDCLSLLRFTHPFRNGSHNQGPFSFLLSPRLKSVYGK